LSQLIQFEGQTHQFPDDFTSGDIQRALSSTPRAGAAAAVPSLPPGFTIDRPAQATIPPLPDVDRAARSMQAATTGSPTALAQDIRENASSFSNPTRAGESPLESSALPTSGLLSRDPGLIALEQGAPIKASPDFIQRDQNVKGAAADRVAKMRDPDADLKARAGRLAPADDTIRYHEEAGRSIDRIRPEEGDLAGGGLIKRFILLLEQLPSNKQSADEIVQMAWFNPDVAAYLPERPVRIQKVSQHNINLRRPIAAANAARDSGADKDLK
jgi:hypothetical protein